MSDMQQTATGALTYHAALVLDNDYDRYQERRAIVAAFLATASDAQYPHLLGDSLKQWAEDIVAAETADVANGLASELLTTALAFVDWERMARDYIAEAREG